MQTIDPIKPYRPLHRTQPRIARPAPLPPSRPHPKVPRLSVDGIVPLPPLRSVRSAPQPITPPVRPAPLPPQRQPSSTPLSSQFSTQQVPQKTEKIAAERSKFTPRVSFSKKGIVVGIIIMVIVVVSAVTTKQPVGQLLVLLYGIAAIVMKVSSRTTFTLALGALVLVPVSLAIIGGTNIISSGLATYAFLLLVIGTISLGLELRRESKLELA